MRLRTSGSLRNVRASDYESDVLTPRWRRDPSTSLGISARGSDAAQAPQVVGDLTAGDPPVPIPNTEVKPRRADGTARESVWERRSLPA